MHIRQSIAIVLLVALPAMAEPAGGPWAQVPALPTGCYRQGDDFEDAAYAAADALQNQKARQEETNEAISRQFRDMDIMEQQQRMVAFMMEHPEEAQQYMQSVQQVGQDANVQIPEMADRQMQLDARLQDLTAEYDAALQQTVDPIKARQQALQASPEWCSPAALARSAALYKEENRAYETLCADWWNEGGAFHGWFAEFKQFQIEFGAQQDELAAGTKLNYEVMGIAADQYRPTHSLSAPIEYLRRTHAVFNKRSFAPASEDAIEVCHDGHG